MTLLNHPAILDHVRRATRSLRTSEERERAAQELAQHIVELIENTTPLEWPLDQRVAAALERMGSPDHTDHAFRKLCLDTTDMPLLLGIAAITVVSLLTHTDSLRWWHTCWWLLGGLAFAAGAFCRVRCTWIRFLPASIAVLGSAASAIQHGFPYVTLGPIHSNVVMGLLPLHIVAIGTTLDDVLNRRLPPASLLLLLLVPLALAVLAQEWGTGALLLLTTGIMLGLRRGFHTFGTLLATLLGIGILAVPLTRLSPSTEDLQNHTDFVLQNLSARGGLVVAIVAAGLLVGISFRLLRTARRRTPAWIGGIAAWLLLSLFGNLLCAAVHWFPQETGVPVPLLSYGGTLTVTTLFALGAAFRVRRQPAAATT